MASQTMRNPSHMDGMTDIHIVYKRQPINPPSKSFISFYFQSYFRIQGFIDFPNISATIALPINHKIIIIDWKRKYLFFLFYMTSTPAHSAPAASQLSAEAKNKNPNSNLVVQFFVILLNNIISIYLRCQIHLEDSVMVWLWWWWCHSPAIRSSAIVPLESEPNIAQRVCGFGTHMDVSNRSSVCCESGTMFFGVYYYYIGEPWAIHWYCCHPLGIITIKRNKSLSRIYHFISAICRNDMI